MSTTDVDVNTLLEDAKSKLEGARGIPFCTGTVPLDAASSILFFLDGDKSEYINFTQPTEEKVKALAQACQPATFGLDQQDVLDETYRKAGKMAASNLSTQFSPLTSGIADTIRDFLLEGKDAQSLRIELDKLNVYGPGSFFKSHVDTPRGDTMFGSLVVVFPTVHDGGALILRQDGQEWTFDSANTIASHNTPHAAFVAFYSDTEHEVSLVNSGYRITITYNLYNDERPSRDLSLLSENEVDASIKAALSSLLNHPDFLADGGLLGFGLHHKYPIQAGNHRLARLENSLKGSDARILKIFKSLSLEVAIKALYKSRSKYQQDVFCLLRMSMEVVPTKYGYVDDEISDIVHYLARTFGAPLVYDYSKGKPDIAADDEEEEVNPRRTRLKPVPIMWMGKIVEARNSIKAPYLAYGNEASLAFTYGDLCLVVNVLPFKERMAPAHEKSESTIDKPQD